MPRLSAVVLTTWAATLLLLLVTGGAQVAHNLGDADDALRLQQVRDLLFGGQGWYDAVQHRFDPPRGTFIHWSRLIDLPLAAMILLLKPFIGLDMAELWARRLWPMIPILPLMAATGTVAARLGDARAAIVAVLFAGIGCSVINLFRPGRIDHHNVQLAATLVIFAAILTASVRAAALAGVVAALMLAVGMETLPYTVLACAIIVFRWASLGSDGVFLRCFFISFAVASLAFFALTVPPSRWLDPACDMISPVYLAPLLLAAASFAGLSRTCENRGATARMALSLVIGVAAVILVALIDPACLRGPLAKVDPRLYGIWLSDVGEARNVFEVYRTGPDVMFMAFALPLSGIVAGGYLLTRRDERRGAILIALLLAIVSFLVALWQIRAAAFAAMFAIPLLAAALVRIADRLQQRPIAWLVGLCVLVNPLTLPLIGLAAGGVAVRTNPPSPAQAAPSAHCTDPRDYRTLAGLKAGVVAAPVDMGSFIIASSAHSALAAPYHRNDAGIIDATLILTSSDETALAVARHRNVDYVVYCATSAAPDRATGGVTGLEARLQRGIIPAWLEPVSGNDRSRVQTYRVLK